MPCLLQQDVANRPHVYGYIDTAMSVQYACRKCELDGGTLCTGVLVVADWRGLYSCAPSRGQGLLVHVLITCDSGDLFLSCMLILSGLQTSIDGYLHLLVAKKSSKTSMQAGRCGSVQGLVLSHVVEV